MTADVPRETQDRLLRLEKIVLAEATRQNLISKSSIIDFYNRHIADSLQLLPMIRAGVLLDIGSGAGFPGLVLASCRTSPVHLVEPRAKRASFLQNAVEALGLEDHVSVHRSKAEAVIVRSVVSITARAVAPLSKLFDMGIHLCDENTRWVLPKGRNALTELEAARSSWQGDFRLVPSVTDADAAIVIAEGVRRR